MALQENTFPKRKTLHLKDCDYSAPGAYFVTICTHNRKNTLSSIVGAIHESPAGSVPDDIASVRLSASGKIVEQVLQHLPPHLGVLLDSYVIMLNHVHLILVVLDEDGRAIRESPLQVCGVESRSTLSKAVGYIKMNATKEIRRTQNVSAVWQRGYHDHVIRHRRDYEEIAVYIRENPLRWRYDCFYTE